MTMTLAIAILISCLYTPQSLPATSGRVVVTIAVEGLRIPAVRVELRSTDRNVVIAQTTTDAIGQVTFPDVPAGRYIVRAVREGFADSESAPFSVDRWRDGTSTGGNAADLRP